MKLAKYYILIVIFAIVAPLSTEAKTLYACSDGTYSSQFTIILDKDQYYLQMPSDGTLHLEPTDGQFPHRKVNQSALFLPSSDGDNIVSYFLVSKSVQEGRSLFPLKQLIQIIKSSQQKEVIKFFECTKISGKLK